MAKAAPNEAWVTLATSDSYALGATVLAYSLTRAGTVKRKVVMITDEVSPPMQEQLRFAFDEVVDVARLDSEDAINLALLERPELGVTFTKLNCWKLTQYEKCVFLDADTLVIRNCDELFSRDELSAAPDAGWPDCFNSGVFVFKPSLETYQSLIAYANEHGSFDGGDQGLLNMYFSDWATKDISKHLSFLYNMCATATYTYLPAYKRFGSQVRIVHFIGTSKPWHAELDPDTGNPLPRHFEHHASDHLLHWWHIFHTDVKTKLGDHLKTVLPLYQAKDAGGPTSSTYAALARQQAPDLANELRHQQLYRHADANRPPNPDMGRGIWERGDPTQMEEPCFENILKKIEETMSKPGKY